MSSLLLMQIACLLVGDAHPYRCHWPIRCSVQCNGSFVSVYAASRKPERPLQPNQVDPLTDISHKITSPYGNRLTVRGLASQTGYVIVVRIARRLDRSAVIERLPQGSGLQQAVDRVKKQVWSASTCI